MSRVFSRRPGRRFPLLTVRLRFVGGCGLSLGNESDAATAPRSRKWPAPRKKALDSVHDPSATCQKAAPRGASIA